MTAAAYPVTVRPLTWRVVSAVLHSTRALGLNYHIEVIPYDGRAAPTYRLTTGGEVLYEGGSLDDARAVANGHFTGKVAAVLE